MQTAIINSLQQFFDEQVTFNEDIDEDAYRCAIREAVDLERNQEIIDFALNMPQGDIQTPQDGLPVLGNVTFV